MTLLKKIVCGADAVNDHSADVFSRRQKGISMAKFNWPVTDNNER